MWILGVKFILSCLAVRDFSHGALSHEKNQVNFLKGFLKGQSGLVSNINTGEIHWYSLQDKDSCYKGHLNKPYNLGTQTDLLYLQFKNRKKDVFPMS